MTLIIIVFQWDNRFMCLSAAEMLHNDCALSATTLAEGCFYCYKSCLLQGSHKKYQDALGCICTLSCEWNRVIVSCCASSMAHYWERHSKVLLQCAEVYLIEFIKRRWELRKALCQGCCAQRVYWKQEAFILLEQKSSDALAYLLQHEHMVVWFHKTQWPWARHVNPGCSRGIVPIKKCPVSCI